MKEHKNFEHKTLLIQLEDAKRRYRHYQISQELDRQNLRMNDPYDKITPRDYAVMIADNRYLLRDYEQKIRNLKKRIFECQRNYDIKR